MFDQWWWTTKNNRKQKQKQRFIGGFRIVCHQIVAIYQPHSTTKKKSRFVWLHDSQLLMSFSVWWKFCFVTIGANHFLCLAPFHPFEAMPKHAPKTQRIKLEDIGPTSWYSKQTWYNIVNHEILLSNTCCFTTNVNIHFKCKRPLLRNLCGPKLLPSKLHPKQDLEDQKTCEDAFHHGPTSEEIIMLNLWGKFCEFQIILKLLGYNPSWYCNKLSGKFREVDHHVIDLLVCFFASISKLHQQKCRCHNFLFY